MSAGQLVPPSSQRFSRTPTQRSSRLDWAIPSVEFEHHQSSDISSTGVQSAFLSYRKRSSGLRYKYSSGPRQMLEERRAKLHVREAERSMELQNRVLAARMRVMDRLVQVRNGHPTHAPHLRNAIGVALDNYLSDQSHTEEAVAQAMRARARASFVHSRRIEQELSDTAPGTPAAPAPSVGPVRATEDEVASHMGSDAEQPIRAQDMVKPTAREQAKVEADQAAARARETVRLEAQVRGEMAKAESEVRKEEKEADNWLEEYKREQEEAAKREARRGQRALTDLRRALTRPQSAKGAGIGLTLTGVKDMFRGWDDDGDGKVDRSEFYRAVEALGLKTSVATCDAAFDAYDVDGSGEIDYKEYVLHTLREVLQQSASRVIDLFRQWDTRGAGVIDAAAFRKGIAVRQGTRAKGLALSYQISRIRFRIGSQPRLLSAITPHPSPSHPPTPTPSGDGSGSPA